MPPDPRALVRVLGELLWALRREGFDVSTAQAIDAFRAAAAVGLGCRRDLREALACVVVERPRDRARFDAAFDGFFDPSPPARRAPTLWQRLSQRGFAPEELAALRSALGRLAERHETGFAGLEPLLDRGSALDRALARRGALDRVGASSGPQLGFISYVILARIGSGPARRALLRLRAVLADVLGARGEALADALGAELDDAEREVKGHVRHRYERERAERAAVLGARRLTTTPFIALTDAQIEEARRAVRNLADRLRGGHGVRARRRVARGRIDPHRTLRRALRTGGVPFHLVRRTSRRDRPKLVVLCDVSDSVRAVGSIFLEFTFALQGLFEQTRSLVFVSEIGEATQLFARLPVRDAIARAWSGEVVPGADNSNYGRVLRTFEARYGRGLDRHTVLLILGDGRTNYHDPAADVLGRLRRRSRAVLWLCPEPRGAWGSGDSAMTLYARECTAAYEVCTVADLERVARVLVA
jgi:uncharacterized protein